MLSFPLFSACLAAVAGMTSATPLMGRQSTGCSPNFEGAGVSVIAGDVEWAVATAAAGQPILHDLGTFPPNATANWFVQQTGSAIATYIFKAINNTELAIDVASDESLILEDINASSLTQIWDITCNQCISGASSTPGGGKFASGCTIQSHPSGLCAQITHGGSGVGLSTCTGVVAQTYDFWTATA